MTGIARWRSGAAALCLACLTACVSVDVETPQRQEDPEVVDLVAPTPGTAPMPTSRAELEQELETVVAALTEAPPGAVAAQEKVLAACLRITALSRGFIGDDAQARAGITSFEVVQLGMLDATCPDDPRKAGEALQRLLDRAGTLP